MPSQRDFRVIAPANVHLSVPVRFMVVDYRGVSKLKQVQSSRPCESVNDLQFVGTMQPFRAGGSDPDSSQAFDGK